MALSLVPPEGRAPPAPTAVEPWAEAWWDAFAAGWRYLEQVSALYDPRQLRSWWLSDVSRLSSEYMRSPSFLALMTFTLK